MLIINIKENESIDKALKRFKKKFEKTGILKELRERTSFTKPSVKRRGEIIHASYVQKKYAQDNY
jgi:small subunit ribosomal protein S21